MDFFICVVYQYNEILLIHKQEPLKDLLISTAWIKIHSNKWKKPDPTLHDEWVHLNNILEKAEHRESKVTGCQGLRAVGVDEYTGGWGNVAGEGNAVQFGRPVATWLYTVGKPSENSARENFTVYKIKST